MVSISSCDFFSGSYLRLLWTGLSSFLSVKSLTRFVPLTADVRLFSNSIRLPLLDTLWIYSLTLIKPRSAPVLILFLRNYGLEGVPIWDLDVVLHPASQSAGESWAGTGYCEPRKDCSTKEACSCLLQQKRDSIYWCGWFTLLSRDVVRPDYAS
jgi:hypothetical protein